MRLRDFRYCLAPAASAQATVFALGLVAVGFNWQVSIVAGSMVLVCVFIGHWLLSNSTQLTGCSVFGSYSAATVFGGVMGLCGGQLFGTIIQFNPNSVAAVLGGIIGSVLGAANAALWLNLRNLPQ